MNWSELRARSWASEAADLNKPLRDAKVWVGAPDDPKGRETTAYDLLDEWARERGVNWLVYVDAKP